MSCKQCEYAPKTYEEYCIGQSNPSIYCPDAYTEKSHLCNKGGERMTQTTTLKDIIRLKQRTEDINEIIKHYEEVQSEDISDYLKERAKIIAYDEIVKIWKEGD